MTVCNKNKNVHVTAYTRRRKGRVEHVREHCRKSRR